MLNAICAVAAFLAAVFVGGDKIEVREWHLRYSATPYSVAVHLDPVFVVWSDKTPGSAWTFFNTICLNERIRGTELEPYILRHELNHVRQFQALGVGVYPASLFLPVEWWPQQADWSRPEENDEHMWQPPSWLRLWHFLTLELRLG
jgi:hypothetical protein